jgi:RNA polymerase sigma-70 factor (ECF subfamily)
VGRVDKPSGFINKYDGFEVPARRSRDRRNKQLVTESLFPRYSFSRPELSKENRMKAVQADGRRRDVLAALAEYEARLTRYAVRLLGDLDLARDAVQHAFVRLCDEPPLAKDRLAAWLYAVCRNKAFDHLRRGRRDESLAGPVFDELTGREPDPAEAAETGDQAAWVRRQFIHLPLPQREALGLWSEGFAYREIAEITCRTEGNIRVLVHRGLTTLRELAKGSGVDSDEPSNHRGRVNPNRLPTP